MYHPKAVAQSRGRLEAALGHDLIEHPLSMIEEMEFRMGDIEWDKETAAPSRPLTPEEESFISNELLMSRIDFRYWLKRYCKILTSDKQIRRFSLWPGQDKLIDLFGQIEIDPRQEALYKKIRLILLKSRQVGGTVIGEALAAHMVFLNSNTQGIIASDHPDNTNKLWQVFLRIYENLPPWMRPHRDAKVKATNLHLDKIESDVVCGSGNQKTTLGQGMNVDAIHLTEVSTWEFPGYIDDDMIPAFNSSEKHHSFVLLESTGAGAKGNWFHDQFQVAARGESQFKSLFVAWFYRPGWRMKSEGVVFQPETLAMAERVRRESAVELSRDQLAWYQITRQDFEGKDKLETFYQEFPSTIEEAFQTGLKSVFPITLRTKIRDTVRQPAGIYDIDVRKKKMTASRELAPGKFIIWEAPRSDSIYTIGVDASHSLDDKSDFAAVEVIRVGNRQRADEQVAEWCGRISPFDLTAIVEVAGNIYKDKESGLPAMVAVECNPGSPGIVTQVELQRRGYPHFYVMHRPTSYEGGWLKEFGWWTTPSTRPLLTEMGVEYIKKGHLLINSPFVVEEMSSFVNIGLDRGKKHLEHAPGYHDDRLFALFIALYCAHDNDREVMADERLKAAERRLAEARGEVKKKPSLQELGLPYEECMRIWEESVGL